MEDHGKSDMYAYGTNYNTTYLSPPISAPPPAYNISGKILIIIKW